MDVNLRRVVVGIVGFSMAVVGFFLSVTVPVVSAILPQFQPQATERTQAILRRRIQERESRDLHRQETSPAAHHDVVSEAGTADSVESCNTVTTDLSSAHHATCTGPPSLTGSPESVPHALPLSTAEAHAKCDQQHAAVMQHICTPQKCSNHASTSAPVPPAQENIEKPAGDGIKKRNSLPARAVNWLKPSPPPAFLHLQPSPRSSGEGPHPSIVSSPRAATFDENSVSGQLSKQRAPRRANTFFGLRRSSKVTTHVGSEPAPAFVSESIQGGSSPEPASPLTVAFDLHDISSDAEISIREQKRRKSYFTRLKKKQSNKVMEDDLGRHTMPNHDAVLAPNNLSQTSERGRSNEKRSKRRICARHRRPATAPSEPVPRTNPYEAPYYFPTPASPDAVNYVQLARTENRRASVSPSAASRVPYRNELRPTQRVVDPSSVVVAYDGVSPVYTDNVMEVAPQNAAGKDAKYVISTNNAQHRRNASIASSSPTMEEFGVLRNRPMSATRNASSTS